MDFESTNAFQNFTFDESKQLRFYKRYNATENILKLVCLNPRSFGCLVEKIAIEKFEMTKSSHPSFDSVKNGTRYEIKTSRYWAGTKTPTFKWQHIEPDHPWDVLLLIGVDFNDLVYYEMTRDNFNSLLGNEIKLQGGGSGQGYWFSLNDIPREKLTICI